MEITAQKDNETIVPQLFFVGEESISVLMRQACIDLNYCYYPDSLDTIFDVPAAGLIARIIRYVDGRQLEFPREINDEYPPFRAIKYTHCEDWESYKKNNGRIEDLDHLRAYFWDELSNNEKLMCITHFIKKTKEKLDPKDTKISQQEKANFLENGCYYSDQD